MISKDIRGIEKDDSDTAKKRKAQVLGAAAECFSIRGFHKTSLAQIAEKANMSTGHIYHYFKSKEDIIAEIVRNEKSDADLFIEKARQAVNDDEAIDMLIEDFAIAAAIHKNTQRASLMMETLAEAARNPFISKVVHKENKEFQESILGIFKYKKSEMKSKLEIISAILHGLSVNALRNPDIDKTLDLDMLKSVVKFILKEA
ncbi:MULTISPECIES: TetR/AcrR family transcriptional regulator [Providencia]|uniref:TetR/AcrR family transcriptional regulator n=1 Tax=Providencia huaxiensis TaxID=2027290 RepID=A0ABU2IS17_9GAMM|nr:MULTISPECIES: TetR/AcrR family transcriptional regulator [Providencia]MBZ3680828.1 TetR/AcrR family transcriptional regulator [Providencia rettgeri]AXH63323.1 TetR/AcrR family transcriptional regulator [Providencia huaxiensis]MDT0131868.1 TetR/AcrR family transcriptional regulator [Providencia huaxiensis]MDT1978274.1 TetR/AcrR family transcriptional regulator [Providencia huaxiensis]QLR01419.1 TetR/AcrR family transcriptional regulator [Providencia rettgeri]